MLYEEYKTKRNYAKSVVQMTHSDSWEAFTGYLEHDLHGRQSQAHKVIEHLNRQNRDCVVLNNILEAEWLSFHKRLWYDESLAVDWNREGNFDNNVDLLHIEEFDLAL